MKDLAPVESATPDASQVVDAGTAPDETADAADGAMPPANDEPDGADTGKLEKAYRRTREENKELRARVKDLESQVLDHQTAWMLRNHSGDILSEAQQSYIKGFPTIEERRAALSAIVPHSNGSINFNAPPPETPKKPRRGDDIPMFG